MKEYSKRQKMLALCYISYYGITFIGKDEKNESRISKMIENVLKKWKPINGEWKLVWGPAVFALPATKFDDSMVYIAQNVKDPSKYTIVIRGTNPFSIPNWIIWDFQAENMKNWPFGDAENTVQISESTSFGLVILQGLRPSVGDNIKQAKVSILEFLQNELKVNNKLDITVTGHSLGGVLAPTLALWLKNIQTDKLKGNVDISVVSFAGPTAGNKEFADFSNKCFKGNALIDYDRVANSLDVVSHAWSQKDLKKLVKLYCPILPGPILYFFIKKMIFTTKKNNYTQIQPNPSILKGKFKCWLPNYLLQAAYQHVLAYPELLDMSKDIDWFDLVKQNLFVRGRLSKFICGK